jgi:hypothetical protein
MSDENIPIWWDIHYRLERFDDDELWEWLPVHDVETQWTPDDLIALSADMGKETNGKYRVVRVEVVHETTFGGETLCEDHYPKGTFVESQPTTN